MTESEKYYSTCPSCSGMIDVSPFEPFSKVLCPLCGQTVRVRRKFDQFVISRQLGEGGMSRVFDAVDETLGRHVALKILNRHYSKSAERIAQFEKEARLTAAVTHPHVVKLFSVGRDQGNFYIAMELVSGGSLENRIQKQGRVEEREVLRVGRAVAEGLRSAYRDGLIHRDVKPANILFTEEDTPKIVDFGLALFHERELDKSGEIWATPFYVAPEKVSDNREDFRSDIYSLGATLYHALTGKPPHKADTNSIQELTQIKSKAVHLEDFGLRFSPRTCDLINRMLKLRPEDRFATYDDLVEAFRDAESLMGYSELRQKTLRQKWIYSAVGLVGMTVLAAAILHNPPTRKHASATVSATIPEDDIQQGKTLVIGGRRTVADSFKEAREVMLKGNYQEAWKRFDEIIASKKAIQPTLNKVRFNAALCAIMAENKEKAQQYFVAIHQDQGLDTTVNRDEGEFFAKIGERMSKDLGLRPFNRKDFDYQKDSEEALGYLAHGLATWHFGQPRGAIEWLRAFNECQPPKGLEWISSYKQLIAPYLADVQLAEKLLKVNRLEIADLASRNPDDARKLLAETRQTLGQLKTNGSLRRVLEKRADQLDRQINKYKRDTLRAETERLQALRKRESSQWMDMMATLPALVAHAYDYTPGVNLLQSSVHFETPEVQSAVENKLYLWSRAQEFMETLMADVKAIGYKGHIQRRQGQSMDGKVVKMTYQDTSVSLEHGEIGVPTESLTPDVLVAMAQSFCDTITDSTDYYRRQELIVVFAKMQGLDELANAVAAQLMEENRGFRLRWMRVAQAGL